MLDHTLEDLLGFVRKGTYSAAVCPVCMMFFLRKTPHRPELNEEREGARRLARRRSRLVLPGLVAGRETRCTGVSSPSQVRGIQMWRTRFPFPRVKILPARPSTEHIDDGERCGGTQRRGG